MNLPVMFYTFFKKCIKLGLHVLQVLSSWSMLGSWSGNKLLIHDGFLLICILWALHNKADISPGRYPFSSISRNSRNFD